MGTSILKGITAGLLVTVLTLLVVLGVTLSGFEETIISYIVDFGLLLSCLAAGYRAGRSSGRILPAGLASGGFALVGVLLLALYFPIEPLGALKVISQGTGLGFLAGVLAVGLSPDHSTSDSFNTGYFPTRAHSFDKKNLYSMTRDAENKVSISYKNRDLPDKWERSSYLKDPKAERAKIYELCKYDQDIIEEDEAFAWWNIDSERKLRGK